MQQNSLKGKVVFYDPLKRQGYVRLPDTREEFHFRLKAGESDQGIASKAWVSFRLSQDKAGFRAIEIQPWRMV